MTTYTVPCERFVSSEVSSISFVSFLLTNLGAYTLEVESKFGKHLLSVECVQPSLGIPTSLIVDWMWSAAPDSGLVRKVVQGGWLQVGPIAVEPAEFQRAVSPVDLCYLPEPSEANEPLPILCTNGILDKDSMFAVAILDSNDDGSVATYVVEFSQDGLTYNPIGKFLVEETDPGDIGHLIPFNATIDSQKFDTGGINLSLKSLQGLQLTFLELGYCRLVRQ